jgi:hypothetical protein
MSYFRKIKKMRYFKTSGFVLAIAFILGIYLSCEKKEYRNLDCAKHPHSFTANIKPIINASCAVSGCHGSGSANGDYTTYAGIKAAVDAKTFEESVLYKQNMPSSGPLPTEQRQAIKCWIEEGAPNN